MKKDGIVKFLLIKHLGVIGRAEIRYVHMNLLSAHTTKNGQRMVSHSLCTVTEQLAQFSLVFVSALTSFGIYDDQYRGKRVHAACIKRPFGKPEKSFAVTFTNEARATPR